MKHSQRTKDSPQMLVRRRLLRKAILRLGIARELRTHFRMAAKSEKPLLFVDTNIFLDSYKADGDSSDWLSLLERL